MGNPTLVGPVGSGQVSKLANQIIVGLTIGAVAEAVTLCEKAGADPKKMIKAYLVVGQIVKSYKHTEKE